VNDDGRVVRAIELLLFVGALSIGGLVASALLWSGEAPYRDLATANGVTRYDFVLQPPLTREQMDLNGGVILHGQWSRYVSGAGQEPPRPSPALFTADEYAHMADVRGVFRTAIVAVPVALVILIVRLQRARLRGGRAMWALVRDGALGAAILVAAVGAVAAVAFEPAFIAFHQIFFPQGNFLFDPATSNLIRLYPDWYWEGISQRVGVTFIVVALGLAALAHLRLRAAK
jgi:integral membrane protein (TIGR01906 family)